MPRQRPPEQLDIPLVWDVEPPAAAPPGAAPPPVTRARETVGLARLLVAALADLGVTLLALAAAWLVAAAAGGLDAVQLLLASAAGLEAATVVAVGCLWGWRGTPGLLLVGVGLDRPLALGRAAGVWVLWLAALPLAGVPLCVGRRKLLERLARASFSCR